MQGSDYVLAWRSDPASLKVSDFFAIDIALCSDAAPAATDVRVDARMPEHQHGINYRPTVKPLGDGRFRAEGLLFHMPGLWEIVFDVRAPGHEERLGDRVTLR